MTYDEYRKTRQKNSPDFKGGTLVESNSPKIQQQKARQKPNHRTLTKPIFDSANEIINNQSTRLGRQNVT